jgi:CO/xanthine dehydrogenase FAD-binding subunit
MILEYHRPKEIEQALALLSREQPRTLPLGGGTVLSQASGPGVAVVDLQLLGLHRISSEGSILQIGATVTLEQLMQAVQIPAALKEAIRLEAGLNVRNLATIAGTIVAGNGESPFLTVLLAGDARLNWLPGDQPGSLGEYLSLRHAANPGKLISQVSIPLQAAIRFASVGRSPMDRPVVCVAVARWPSGRTRVALGGLTAAPLLAMDGTDAGGAESAIINACSHLDTKWASREYIQETAKTLVSRLITD